jgi:hypothetical protein
MLRIWLWHVAVGVPAAAFAFSALQFAHHKPFAWEDLWLFPLYYASAILVGSLILVPAYTLQALLFQGLRLLHRTSLVQIGAGGLFQAGLLTLWAVWIGIEPSLAGNFDLTLPTLVAGFLVGALTAAVTCRYA